MESAPIADASLERNGTPTTLSLLLGGDGLMVHKDRDTEENLVPACHACNLHKHSHPLENYRRIIDDGRNEFLRSGKGKALVRMGLVEMKHDPIVFYFERYQKVS